MAEFIFITGATSGVGEAVVLNLSLSYKLILCDKNLEKLNELKGKCKNSGDHLVICLDLLSEKNALFDRINLFLSDNNVTASGFIHCAGMTRILPLRNFTADYVSEIFDVNILSSLEILRALLKKENKGALKNIIFISALWSKRGDIGNSIYAASKGAINSLVLTLARELAPKVRVNSVVPGAIDTPMTRSLLADESLRTAIEKDYPLGLGKPEDIAGLIEFLLSDKARWITGQNINIDGGRSTK